MGLVITERSDVALIAPRDIDSAEAGPESSLGKYVVLFHPAYRHGVPAVEFPDTSLIELKPAPGSDTDDLGIPPVDDYQDPVSSADKGYEGRWMAGFALIGDTGFVVVSQQRYEEATTIDPAVFWNLALWSTLITGVAMAILAMFLWRWAWSRRLGFGMFS